jgi:hypothetical protein
MVVFHIDRDTISARDETTGRKAEVANTLKHPRLLVGDYSEASRVFKVLLKQVRPGWHILKPAVAVTLGYELEGGITEIEKRVVAEALALQARSVDIKF